MTAVAHARGGGFGRSVLLAAMRGGILIGLAVVIGIVLLQVVDDAGKGGAGAGGGGGVPLTTTTTGVTGSTGITGSTQAGTATTKKSSTTTTTRRSTTTTAASTARARPHEQVRVQVLNGSGVAGAAGTRTNDLKTKGYQTLAAGNASEQRTGTVVQCKAGFEADGLELVSVLQSIGVTARTEAFPNPPPAGSDSLDCYVVLGK